MADDRKIGRLAHASGQERDRHGRFAAVPRGVAGTLYDPERRQLYRLWSDDSPAARLPTGTAIRVDRGALYLPVLRGDLGAIPPVTPRGFTLGLAAIMDAALAYSTAAWLDQLVGAASLSLDRIGLAIGLYFGFFGWFCFARLTIALWPPPEPPVTSFETIDELAERRGWRKPRNTRFDDELSREEDDA